MCICSHPTTLVSQYCRVRAPTLESQMKHVWEWSFYGWVTIMCQALHQPWDISRIKFCACSLYRWDHEQRFPPPHPQNVKRLHTHIKYHVLIQSILKVILQQQISPICSHPTTNLTHFLRAPWKWRSQATCVVLLWWVPLPLVSKPAHRIWTWLAAEQILTSVGGIAVHVVALFRYVLRYFMLEVHWRFLWSSGEKEQGALKHRTLKKTKSVQKENKGYVKMMVSDILNNNNGNL